MRAVDELLRALARNLRRAVGTRRAPAPADRPAVYRQRPAGSCNELVGRELLVARMLRALPRNHLLLIGEAGIGKTAVLRHLERRLPGLDDPDVVLHPVYLSLEGRCQHELFPALSEAVAGTLGRAALVSGPDADSPSGSAFRQLLRELRRQVEALQRLESRWVWIVLLIDHIHQLDRYDPRVSQRLRSLFMTGLAEHLVAVAAGRDIDRDWQLEGSPWFNFFDEVPVGPLAPEPARRLVRRAMAKRLLARGTACETGAEAAIDPAAAALLVSSVGGRPGALLDACRDLVVGLDRWHRGPVTVREVQALLAARARGI